MPVILFHIVVYVFDTLKIPVHHSGTKDTIKKKVICLNLSQALAALFLVLCQFYMNLTDHAFTVGSFVQAVAFM